MGNYSLGQLEEDLIKVNRLLSNGRYACSDDHYIGFSLFTETLKDLEVSLGLISKDDYYLLHNTILMYSAVRKLFSSKGEFKPLQDSMQQSFRIIVNHPHVKELNFNRKYQ